MSKTGSSVLPLGQAESVTLEFKSRQVLQELGTVGKGVVAFLNAQGGNLWIGLSEHRGRAVVVEPIADPERERRRVHDFLVDSIEPRLTDEEIKVDVIEEILRVQVSPRPECMPYAMLHNGARHFLIRVGDRKRPMTREEIFKPAGQDDRLSKARECTSKLRDKARNENAGMSVSVRPVGDVRVNLDDSSVKDLLSYPEASGNRNGGWNFIASYRPPTLKKERLLVGRLDQKHTEIYNDGTIAFAIPMSGLHWRGDPNVLWPYSLVEYPVSVMRLAGALLDLCGHPSDDQRVLVDLAMFGVTGWKLGPHSPDSISYQISSPPDYSDDEPDLEWEPLILNYEDLINEPDRCGFRLVRRIYEAFGYGEDKIIREFNGEEGRLVFGS